ncbi:MAG TPA: translational GTPase TypA [Cryomorphaceae bacterium]|nr:translational GTPase TypA [Cryomorphaceae bacterium]HCY25661.1 translational GTPase TypA [Cryomorphaceae bacterium]|tara:strand:- start:7533 stop:9326 length:1794 start_codon:yes stop_codon:yes gene_type:complete
MKLRNIAIIAHVDHGKTTLVDNMLHTAKLFRDNQQVEELLLDSNELERERGITILSKNVSIRWKDTKINIIDTPGHSDFGGEVERVLNMADGVILLVDAFEGPMPQTRFVLQKALSLNKVPIVVINKVDKPNCAPDIVHDQVFELFFNLEANDDQLDFKTVYGSGKEKWMGPDWETPTNDITYLLDSIVDTIPEPAVEEGNLQLQITSLAFSSFTGRIAIGRIKRGSIKENMQIVLCKRDGTIKKAKIKELMVFEGLGKTKVANADAGEIVAVSGLEDFEIGDTIASIENPEALPTMEIDKPTMSMLFSINNSPFFGREGKHVTSQKIRERLMLEIQKNLALKVQDTGSADQFIVHGRGILHLGILIETMRREGYELQLGMPQVINKTVDGKKHEPIEELTVDVPAATAGKVIEMVTKRKGELLVMEAKSDLTRLEFEIPSRGLMGLRNNVLTATAGEAIMAHRLKNYQAYKGDMERRISGVLVAKEAGKASTYSMDKLQDRGKFFIEPGQELYGGQVIGEANRPGDLVVNPCIAKQLNNMRAAGKDDNSALFTPIKFSLEEAMEYIGADEYVEVTPESIRIRKILLNESDRKRSAK